MTAPDFTHFRSRHDVSVPCPAWRAFQNVVTSVLWMLLVLGSLATVAGFIGLWLWKFSGAWAWFALGFNTAVWSYLILMARLELRDPAHSSPESHQSLPAHRVECAWCHTLLREGDATMVSHGICEPCHQLHFPTEGGGAL